ncbi:MAG TPA: hypothetical protein DFS52_28175 [Myxococcales bacterium]|nr:hypothetical protein [Myxococcales bacterium]
MSLRYFAIACSVFALGCPELSRQGSDSPDDAGAHRVELAIPVRGRVRPYLMLVVDKSGSMNDSASAESTTTKWDDLVAAFADPSSGFLTTSRDQLHFGLTLFPSSMACDPGRIVVPLSTYRHNADQVVSRLASTVPEGGTPTSLSLQVAATDPRLVDAEPEHPRFVMLLTDGLPNCNDSNAGLCAGCRSNTASCGSQSGCRPTEPPYDLCEPRPFDGAPCLDEENLVGAIEELRAKGIVTLVIGFGRATASGNASRVLNRAAVEGGHPRQGATESYYQANTVEELKGFLEELLREFPCELALAPKPTAANLVTVNVRDSKAGAGGDNILKLGRDWEFTGEDLGGIRLLGGWCNLVQNAEFGRYELQVIYADPL